MTKISTCPSCSKKFTRNFNMKMHMKTCLKKDHSMIYKQNKLTEFDQLKKNLIYMKSKLESLKATFKEKQNHLKSKEFEYQMKENRKREYTDFENDPTLPQGWKSCKGFQKSISVDLGRKFKNVVFPKVFLAPNGRLCRSRRNAILYMKTQLNSSEEDINIMLEGLLEDGWNKVDIIDGWYWKTQISKEKKKVFISKDFLYLDGIWKALKHLSIYGSEEELLTFIKEYVRQDVLTIEEVFDHRIPFPWRAISVDTLKGHSFIFITPFGNINTSIKGVLKAIANSEFSTEHKGEFIEFLHSLKNRNANGLKDLKSIDIKWVHDEAIPTGWTIRENKSLIKNPDGHLFKDRKEACVFLIKNKYSPDDIFKLWSSLHHDGWNDDKENLPTGWKKKYVNESQSYHFLSPLMDEIKSKEELSQFIKCNTSEYKDFDISKINFL